LSPHLRKLSLTDSFLKAQEKEKKKKEKKK
jgi:hypothetical protein